MIIFYYWSFHFITPFILPLTRSIIEDPEFACLDPRSDVLQEQEYVKRIVELG